MVSTANSQESQSRTTTSSSCTAAANRDIISCPQEFFHQEIGGPQESFEREIFRSQKVRQNCLAQHSQAASDSKKKKRSEKEQFLSQPILSKTPNNDQLLKEAPDSRLLSNRFKLFSFNFYFLTWDIMKPTVWFPNLFNQWKLITT